jgi:hypothetical protein
MAAQTAASPPPDAPPRRAKGSPSLCALPGRGRFLLFSVLSGAHLSELDDALVNDSSTLHPACRRFSSCNARPRPATPYYNIQLSSTTTSLNRLLIRSLLLIFHLAHALAVPLTMDVLNLSAEQLVDQALRFSAITGLTRSSAEDRFFLVMGKTGSGKSTFIARCTGQDVTVGHGLYSCTSRHPNMTCDH